MNLARFKLTPALIALLLVAGLFGLGGTLIAGGVNSYTGTMTGALVLTVIGSLLTTLQLPESVRQIVYGVVLLLLLSVYGRQRSLRQ